MNVEPRVSICQNCENRKFSSSRLICGRTGKDPEYESQCEYFVADEFQINRQKAVEKQSIHGWLAFFLFVLGFSVAATLVSGYMSVAEETDPLSQIMEAIYTFSLASFSSYAIYSFLKRRSNAVALGKMTLILLFIDNLYALMYTLTGETISIGEYVVSSVRIVRDLIWCSVWFAFLIYSRQVRELFPIEKRMILKFDKFFFGAALLFPLLFFLISMFIGIKAAGDEESRILHLETDLREGKYQDGDHYATGYFSFRKPAEMEIESEVWNDRILYVLTYKDIISCTIIGDDLGEMSYQQYFDEVNESFRDETEEEVSYVVTEDKSGLIQGQFSLLQSTRKYDTFPVRLETITTLLDPTTNRMLVVSYEVWDCEEARKCHFLDDLIASVEF